MKKFLLIVVTLLSLLVIGIYLFLPAQITVTEAVDVKSTVTGSTRVLQDISRWRNWWPAANTLNRSDDLIYNGIQYKVTEKLYNQFAITSILNGESIKGHLAFVGITNDSMRVFLSYEMPRTSQPLKRFSRYRKAKHLQNNARPILTALKQYLESTENIYGVNIIRTPTEKTFLVATTRYFDHYPTTGDVYTSIESLKKYAAQNNALVTDHPMLNITRREKTKYECMVALPVNKELPGNGDIAMRKIVTIKALFTSVKGGNGKIEQAIQELNNYTNDHRLFSPAISYQTLVTDRSKQPDTLKWITGVYQPLL